MNQFPEDYTKAPRNIPEPVNLSCRPAFVLIIKEHSGILNLMDDCKRCGRDIEEPGTIRCYKNPVACKDGEHLPRVSHGDNETEWCSVCNVCLLESVERVQYRARCEFSAIAGTKRYAGAMGYSARPENVSRFFDAGRLGFQDRTNDKN